MSETNVNTNINSVVDNFNGGSVGRDDLAPAIVFAVAVGSALLSCTGFADHVARAHCAPHDLALHEQEALVQDLDQRGCILRHPTRLSYNPSVHGSSGLQHRNTE
jgi:hypothetical protein